MVRVRGVALVADFFFLLVHAAHAASVEAIVRGQKPGLSAWIAAILPVTTSRSMS